MLVCNFINQYSFTAEQKLDQSCPQHHWPWTCRKTLESNWKKNPAGNPHGGLPSARLLFWSNCDWAYCIDPDEMEDFVRQCFAVAKTFFSKQRLFIVGMSRTGMFSHTQVLCAKTKSPSKIFFHCSSFSFTTSSLALNIAFKVILCHAWAKAAVVDESEF